MPRLPGKASLAVLSIDASCVEWFDGSDPEHPLYGVAPVRGARPGDLAEAASEALVRSEGSSLSCVVALSDSLVDQRLLHVPQVPRRELQEVFARKTSRQIEVDKDDVVFSSSLVDEKGLASEAPDAALQTWLVAAARRSFLTELRVQLRRRGFRVHRVVAMRPAPLCRALALCEGTTQACISVAVDRSATSIGLIAGHRLFSQFRLVGDFNESAILGTSVLQDIRNCAGFWRRVSRGGAVERVVVSGLDSARGESLARSIADALDGVHVDWRPRFPDHPEAGRLELLASCLDSGPFHADLTTSIPPAGKTVAGALAGTLALAMGVVGFVQIQAGSKLDSLHAELAELSSESTGLEHALSEAEDARASVDRFAERFERAARSSRHGVAVAELLPDVLSAFRGRADLLSIDVRRAPDATNEVTLTGSVDSDPVELVHALHALADDLRRAGLRSVVIHPPVEVPSDGEARATFSIEALLGTEASGEERE